MEFNIDVALQNERDNPSDFINLYNIGLYYFNIGKVEDSIEYLEKSVNLADSYKGEILFQLALSYERVDEGKGRKILDEALTLCPELEAKFYMGSRTYYGKK